jgi:hypothetical protein
MSHKKESGIKEEKNKHEVSFLGITLESGETLWTKNVQVTPQFFVAHRSRNTKRKSRKLSLGQITVFIVFGWRET